MTTDQALALHRVALEGLRADAQKLQALAEAAITHDEVAPEALAQLHELVQRIGAHAAQLSVRKENTADQSAAASGTRTKSS